MLTFIISKLKVVIECGEEVFREFSVEIVQRLRTVPAALQTKSEMVRHRAGEVWVPEKGKVFFLPEKGKVFFWDPCFFTHQAKIFVL